jgi:hypothetical protein
VHTPSNTLTWPAGASESIHHFGSHGRTQQLVGIEDVPARRPPTSGSIAIGGQSFFEADSHMPLPPMALASSRATRSVEPAGPGMAGWAIAAAEQGRPDSFSRRTMATGAAVAAQPLPVVDAQFVYNTIVDGLAGHVLVDTRLAPPVPLRLLAPPRLPSSLATAALNRSTEVLIRFPSNSLPRG